MLQRLASFAIIAALFICAIQMVAPRTETHAQSSHLKSYAALTMTGSRQQLNTSGGSCIFVQLSAPTGNAAAITVGDVTITSTIGIQLPAGSARKLDALSSRADWSLSQIYALGTMGDKLQFDCAN